MPESETDLVGGFHTEYGSFKFGIFFVAEYAHIVIGSAIFTIIFLGGWHFLPWIADPWPATWVGTLIGVFWFLAKTIGLIFFFIWIRWTLPRFRYDQVMSLGWTKLLPLSLNLFLCDFSSLARSIGPSTLSKPWQKLWFWANRSHCRSVPISSNRDWIEDDLFKYVQKKVTLQYPEERPAIPKDYRSVPAVKIRMVEKCVSCQLCELSALPKPFALLWEVPEDESDREHVEKAPQEFEINMLRCIYCGYCQEVCPEEAIFLQQEYSSSGYTREEMINNKQKLYELGGVLPDKHYKWDKKKEAELEGNAH